MAELVVGGVVYRGFEVWSWVFENASWGWRKLTRQETDAILQLLNEDVRNALMENASQLRGEYEEKKTEEN